MQYGALWSRLWTVKAIAKLSQETQNYQSISYLSFKQHAVHTWYIMQKSQFLQ